MRSPESDHHILRLAKEVITAPSLISIPGPFLARFTRLWYFNRVLSGNFDKENLDLHKKYGPIVRLSPGHYSISKKADVKTVYGAGSRFTKAAWYDAFKEPSPHNWSVFTDRDNKRHSETRRKFSSLYSMSSLLHYEGFVDASASIFMERLNEFAQKEETIDFHHWLQCYAFDVIGQITFGQRFGFLNKGEDIMGAISTVRQILVFSCLAGIYVEWYPLLYKLMNSLPGSGPRGLLFIINFVVDKVRQLNEKRIQGGENPSETTIPKTQDFMERMAVARDENPAKITDYHLQMMGNSNVIAGSDTTAITLSAIMYYLLRTPHVHCRLRREIDEFTSQNRCSERITFKESQEMPYLQAVIREALRMHTATGLPLWREVPSGGAEINGYFIPQGSAIGINTWVAHYDEEFFPDAKSFIPERWIEGITDAEQLRKMNEMYMPFGLGGRTCLGKHISTLEIYKLIPQLIRDFDFELENQTWTTENLWFVKPMDFRVKVLLRKQE
ncbi:cytochrome protein [Penicillium angulare]|uniref:cytochrome protein n=1 Tax=Penicillium angulare TaxID=116970 RepID=UPI0025401FAA|nr:cytochrome protein [Penicillium angulare]KAJ5287205.1 cytochrome protein [Penicillium angulare]